APPVEEIRHAAWPSYATDSPGEHFTLPEFKALLRVYDLREARVALSPISQLSQSLLPDEEAGKFFHWSLVLKLGLKPFGTCGNPNSSIALDKEGE
ncbi:unnamed protein product, partial [Amoebophrya sp. A25]